MKPLLIAIIVIILLSSAPAYADTPQPPRPPGWDVMAATKSAVDRERRKPTVTPTVTPAPYPYPAPYPEPEGEPPAVWRWLVSWIAE